MGCFSFLCKVSGEPALSTSFDGSGVYMFLLKDGKVIEEMYGNYDSYGRVFKKGKQSSFKWQTPWDEVCDLMFSWDHKNGIAIILEKYYTGQVPYTRSYDDPDQGWGVDGELMGDTSCNMFKEVDNPYHKVYITGEESETV